MKKILSVLLLVSLQTGLLLAQGPVSKANHDIILTIQSEDGNNGLAVAYNPKMKMYYTAYAGNESYPLEVHSSDGRSIYSTQLGGDARGFWFNPKKNQLEGILYNNQGSFVISLDPAGYPKPIKITSFSYGMEPQNVATNFNGNLYFANAYGYVFKFKQGKAKSKDIKITEAYTQWFSLNHNGIFHTGKKGYEIGFFNFVNNTVVLFNEKNGNVATNIKLNIPSYITAPESFNLSYCNDRVFIYDKNERKWFGFKIF